MSEKGWVKLANHFTILLSDKDTEILTKLQSNVDGFRYAMGFESFHIKEIGRRLEQFLGEMSGEKGPG